MSRRRPPPTRVPPGIEVRHGRACASSRDGGACDCSPTFRAWVSVPGTRKKLQKTFKTLSAAVTWREDASVDLRRGAMGPPTAVTVRQAADAWLIGAKAGSVRNRSGDTYKPSVLRGYEQALRAYVVPELGGIRLSDLRRAEVQAFVDRMIASGASASTVRNALMPLRVILRRALVRGELHANPTQGLELPAYRGRRERIASPAEAVRLIDAVPQQDRAIWATAIYAGLRRGELQALEWDDVDLERRIIGVRRSWDQYEGPIEPKSRAAVRRVPILGRLMPEFEDLQRTAGALKLVFGRDEGIAFSPRSVDQRAQRAWTRAGLEPIGLHECRHTYASLMIAAGVNVKALQTFMGHASITITLDLYGHLLPGSEDVAAALADAFLDRAWGEHAGNRAPR